jgi:hypothetical protein
MRWRQKYKWEQKATHRKNAHGICHHGLLGAGVHCILVWGVIT